MFHISDIKVYIGAKYDTENEKWYWSDGSTANFPAPTSSTCQRKVLRYGKTWEYVDTACSGYQTMFACQTKCEWSQKKIVYWILRIECRLQVLICSDYVGSESELQFNNNES